MSKHEDILEKFIGILSRWIKLKRSGTLTLTIHLNQGGVIDWDFQRNGKEDS
jgi:hypothetical protein